MDLIPLSSVIVPQRKCTVDLNLSETKLLQDCFKTQNRSRKRVDNAREACPFNKKKRTYQQKSNSNTNIATDGHPPLDMVCKDVVVLHSNSGIMDESPCSEKEDPVVENAAESVRICKKGLQSTCNKASGTNQGHRNPNLDVAKSFDSGVDSSYSESASFSDLSPPLSADSESGVSPLAVSSPKYGLKERDGLRKCCVADFGHERNNSILKNGSLVQEGCSLEMSSTSKASSLFCSSGCKLPFEYAVSMAENLRPRKALFLEQDETSDKETSLTITKNHLWEISGVSSIVFGKPKGFGWWPGVIVDHKDIKQRPALDSCHWIRWFGDGSVSEALAEQLCPFATFPEKYADKLRKGKYRKAIKEALELVARQLGAENLLNGKDDYRRIQSLVDWAMKTFGEGRRSCGVNEGCGIVFGSSGMISALNLGCMSSSDGNKEDEKSISLEESVEDGTRQREMLELSPQQETQRIHRHEQKVIQEENSETSVLNLLDCPNEPNPSSQLNVRDENCTSYNACGSAFEKIRQDNGNLKTTSVKHVHALGNGGEGSLVFGKLKGFDWWPAMIISEREAKQREPLPRHCWIRWFGDAKISGLRINQVESLSKFPLYFLPAKMRGLYKKAVNEALMDAAKRCGMMELTALEDSEERLDALITWGKSGFPSKHLENSPEEHFIIEDNCCSEEQRIPDNKGSYGAETCQEPDNSNIIRPSNEKHVKTSKTRFGNVLDKPTLSSNVKRLFDEVYEGKRNIEEICLACGDTDVTSPHPLFEGGFCTECHGLFLETAYLLDEDGYQMYCTICNDGTEVIMCDQQGCFRSYCSVCIDMFCGVGTTEEIQRRETWICFLCSGEKVRLLKSRNDWQGRMKDLFSTEDQDEFPPLQLFPPVPVSDRKPLRVLALFDGIASGLLALRELGIDVEYYAASEIDEQAIAVSHVKHNGVIHQLGDIRHITEKDIAKLGPFDLVLGGSPCNDLSIANPLRKGIYEGTGRLFFEFFRLLMYARPVDENSRPFFWLFENVVGMRHEDRKTISRFLQCNPCMVDAKEVSPMHRARYFWGNLPGMSRGIHPHPGDKLLLRECLEPNSGREARFEKVRTITTRGNSLKQTKDMLLPVTMKIGSKTQEDGLWCTEIERLFGFPDHYTDVACMGRTHRQKLLGSAWCIPVIRHLLSPLRDYFKTVDKSTTTDG